MRMTRAVMTSATVLSLALGAHTMAGGVLPPGLVLMTLGAFVFLAATHLARWHLRLPSLVPVLATLQLALHATLTFLAPGSMTVLTSAAPHAHAGGSGTALALAAPVHAASHHGGTAVSMVLAHAAATVLTALVLVGADRAARLAIHWLRSVLPLIQAPLATLHFASIAVSVPELVAVRPPAVWVVACPRRGPPAGTALA